jgi:hypothetical protein
MLDFKRKGSCAFIEADALAGPEARSIESSA